MLWNERCLESIRNQKKEIESRYGIRIGQTEVYCSRCGKSWGYGKHSCQDIRLERLNETKQQVKTESTPEHCKRIKAIGQRKVAVKLGLDHHTVSAWIRKGSVPLKYHESVMGL